MNDNDAVTLHIVRLEVELELLRRAPQDALAIVSHCLAVQQDAKALLMHLMANSSEAMQGARASEVLDELLAATLMTASSVAMTQRPHDPEMKELYRGLRDGSRH